MEKKVGNKTLLLGVVLILVASMFAGNIDRGSPKITGMSSTSMIVIPEREQLNKETFGEFEVYYRANENGEGALFQGIIPSDHSITNIVPVASANTITGNFNLVRAPSPSSPVQPSKACVRPTSGLVISSDIEFCSGQYTLSEGMVVVGSAKIVGKDTVINGPNRQCNRTSIPCLNALTIQSNNVVITGIHFNGWDRGISSLYRGPIYSNVEIYKNKMTQTIEGIWLHNIEHLNIHNNIIRDAYVGMIVEDMTAIYPPTLKFVTIKDNFINLNSAWFGRAPGPMGVVIWGFDTGDISGNIIEYTGLECSYSPGCASIGVIIEVTNNYVLRDNVIKNSNIGVSIALNAMNGIIENNNIIDNRQSYFMSVGTHMQDSWYVGGYHYPMNVLVKNNLVKSKDGRGWGIVSGDLYTCTYGHQTFESNSVIGFEAGYRGTLMYSACAPPPPTQPNKLYRNNFIDNDRSLIDESTEPSSLIFVNENYYSDHTGINCGAIDINTGFCSNPKTWPPYINQDNRPKASPW